MKKESSLNVGRWVIAAILFASVSATSAYLVVRRHQPDVSMFSPVQAQSLASLETAFSHVAQRLEPSVVTVTSRGKPQMPNLREFFGNPRQPSDPDLRKRLEDQMKRFFEQQKSPSSPREFKFEFPSEPNPQLVRPAQSRSDTPDPIGVGSGLIVRKDGYILTNAHVVRDAEQVDVALNDGTILPAKIVGKDPRGDVAVLKVDAKQDLPAVTLGDSDKVKVGQWAIAVGNPVNLKGTVSVGVVCGLNRSLGPLISLIQTDVAITSGSSGGPLCNLQGEVIGINTMITRESVGTGLGIPFEGGVTGYGFAIPINAAKRSMDDLISKGKVSYGYLGVLLEPLAASKAAEANVKKGVSVRSVTPGTPGEKAGVQVGDIVTHVDGKEVGSMEELQREIRTRRAGDKVKLTILRNKKPQEVTVQLGELPDLSSGGLPLPQEPKSDAKPESDKGKSLKEFGMDSESEEPSAPPTPKPDIKLHEWRGMTAQELDSEARDYLKLPKGETGVLVAGVMQETPAYKAGLDASDVIQEIDGQQVKNLADFERITQSLDAKKPVKVRVKRKGETKTMTVAP
jgi:serine protease Do